LVKKKQSAKAEILIIILTIAIVSGAFAATRPGPPSIDVQVIPKGGFLDNITVSCYQCVPYDKDPWQATLNFEGIPTIDIHNTTDASVGFSLKYGFAVPLDSVSSCPGYHTNSLCVVSLSNTLPFTIGIDFRKTSTGGNLKVILYYGGGKGLVFNATSGNIARMINFESV
jgi:hypothetical protein